MERNKITIQKDKAFFIVLHYYSKETIAKLNINIQISMCRTEIGGTIEYITIYMN